MVKAATAAADYPAELFSSHSLRAGFLTEAGRRTPTCSRCGSIAGMPRSTWWRNMSGTRNPTVITPGKASCDEGPEDPGNCSPVLASDSPNLQKSLSAVDGWLDHQYHDDARDVVGLPSGPSLAHRPCWWLGVLFSADRVPCRDDHRFCRVRRTPQGSGRQDQDLPRSVLSKSRTSGDNPHGRRHLHAAGACIF